MDHRDYRDRLAELPARELAFDEAEYRRRADRVRAAMDAAGLDALLVTEPASLCWLTGYTTFEVSVHACLLFPRTGAPVLQVASIEVAPAVLTTWVDDVVGYDWEHPGQIGRQLADALRRRGLAGAAVGAEDGVPGLSPRVRGEIATALPGARLVDATGLVRGVRAVKSDAELAVLREAAAITRAGISAAMDAAAPGRRDSDVAAAGYEAMMAAGSEFPSMPAIVSSGARSGWIHTCFRRVPLAAGEVVFAELGGCLHRYTAPMMRTACLGEPTPEIRRVADAAADTVQRLLGAIRPGRSGHDVAREAAGGLAPVADEVFFSGVFGYAVGAGMPPSWVEGSVFLAEGTDRELEPGMVFHLPICYRAPGRFGIGLSETVAVTGDGCEVLTATERSLRVVPS